MARNDLHVGERGGRVTPACLSHHFSTLDFHRWLSSSTLANTCRAEYFNSAAGKMYDQTRVMLVKHPDRSLTSP